MFKFLLGPEVLGGLLEHLGPGQESDGEDVVADKDSGDGGSGSPCHGDPARFLVRPDLGIEN